VKRLRAAPVSASSPCSEANCAKAPTSIGATDGARPVAACVVALADLELCWALHPGDLLERALGLFEVFGGFESREQIGDARHAEKLARPAPAAELQLSSNTPKRRGGGRDAV